MDRIPCAGCGIPVKDPHEDADPSAGLCDRCYVDLIGDAEEPSHAVEASPAPLAVSEVSHMRHAPHYMIELRDRNVSSYKFCLDWADIEAYLRRRLRPGRPFKIEERLVTPQGGMYVQRSFSSGHAS